MPLALTGIERRIVDRHLTHISISTPLQRSKYPINSHQPFNGFHDESEVFPHLLGTLVATLKISRVLRQELLQHADQWRWVLALDDVGFMYPKSFNPNRRIIERHGSLWAVIPFVIVGGLFPGPCTVAVPKENIRDIGLYVQS